MDMGLFLQQHIFYLIIAFVIAIFLIRVRVFLKLLLEVDEEPQRVEVVQDGRSRWLRKTVVV